MLSVLNVIEGGSFIAVTCTPLPLDGRPATWTDNNRVDCTRSFHSRGVALGTPETRGRHYSLATVNETPALMRRLPCSSSSNGNENVTEYRPQRVTIAMTLPSGSVC